MSVRARGLQPSPFGALVVALVSAALAGAVAVSGALFTGLSANPSNSLATMTVQPPASLNASSGSGGAVNLTWSASTTSPGSGHTLSYLVLRGPVGGPYAQIGSTGASVLSYSDTPSTDGAYGYVVLTKVSGTGAFQSANSPTASAISDRVAPAVSVTFPAAGGSYSSASWGGTSGVFSGSTTDNGTGIPSNASITLTITRSSTGTTWNGTSFASGTNTVTATTYDPSSGGWTYAFPSANFPAADSYSVQVQGADGALNVGSSGPVSFSYGVNGTLVYAATGTPTAFTSGTTKNVAYPAGTSTNDLLFLVEANSANQAITTPTGWTLLADQTTNSPAQFRFTVWWKLAASGETSVSLSVHTNGSGASAWVVRYVRPSGYPPSPASAGALQQGISGAAATLTPSPDLTTSGSNATVISIVAVRSANALSLGTARGFAAEVATTSTPTGQGTGIAIGDELVTTSGTTAVSPTWSQGGTPAQWAWATVAFR